MMAHEEHLRRLTCQEGVLAWNQWRKQHPGIRPDLRQAVLNGVDLEDADLHAANLEGAALQEANLSGANLERANLRQANLCEARLTGARLWEATLQHANCADADFDGATGLSLERLAGTNLGGAKLPETVRQFEPGLTRVENTAQGIQQIFFSLVVACTYCWLTIAATTDTQLVTNSASTPLPIIGTEIPIVGFYLIAPLFVLCFYIYFHLQMQRLWEMLAVLPAIFPDGALLDRKSYPRPLSGFVRQYIRHLSPWQTAASRWQARMFIAITWWSVPITLAAFWWTYMPRRDWIGAVGAVLLLLFLSVGMTFGVLSYRHAASTLQDAPRRVRGVFGLAKCRRLSRLYQQSGIASLLILVVTVLLVGLFAVKVTQRPNCFAADERDNSWMRRGRTPWEHLFCYPVANLARASISGKPANWSGEGKETEFALVKGASLRHSNLRYALAFQAFFVRADLYKADLSFAYLRSADFRKAELQEASLYKADLFWALLTQADLRQVNAREAKLLKADLRGASLSVFTDCYEGCLRPVDLRQAVLRYATLEGADLKGADLSEARLQDSSLEKTSLQGACLRGAKLQRASLREARLNRTTVHMVCARDPLSVCPLNQTQDASACEAKRIVPPGSDHDYTVLEGTDLSAANLARANLKDANLHGANLHLSNLAGVDLRTTKGLTQDQLNLACLDDTTQVPAHLTVPARTTECQDKWRLPDTSDDPDG